MRSLSLSLTIPSFHQRRGLSPTMPGIPATWTTSFLLAIYALIATALWTQTTLLKPPEHPSSSTYLSFTQAYMDVHAITSHPHPYNSFTNDDVRAYLERMRNLSMGYVHIEVDDDLSSITVFVNAREGVDFKGTIYSLKWIVQNLTKVEFCSHFDLVSTAPGITDNAIAVLLPLRYWSTLQCTAIFNFNDEEEDGLNGAHASSNTHGRKSHKFLKLEGPEQAELHLLIHTRDCNLSRLIPLQCHTFTDRLLGGVWHAAHTCLSVYVDIYTCLYMVYSINPSGTQPP
ncbi:hypothetical protein BDQ17DRAFT_367118 [Cyathus striatus]|nr:hypothetical protein BDQ17DRAFT_367118 [Cyathus striatus]